jgi:hypothetical protein
MKRCSYCGAEYAEDAIMCAIDHTLLEPSNQAPVATPPLATPAEDVQLTNEGAENIHGPEYFRCLWRIDTSDADKLLNHFMNAGVRFRIEQVATPQRMMMSLGYPPMPKVNVYVHLDDKEKAMKILAAEWKV